MSKLSCSITSLLKQYPNGHIFGKAILEALEEITDENLKHIFAKELIQTLSEND
jgi:hypothetical protein